MCDNSRFSASVENFNLIPEGFVTNLFSKLLHEYKVHDQFHHLFKIAGYQFQVVVDLFEIAGYQFQVVVVETQKKSPVRCLLNAIITLYLIILIFFFFSFSRHFPQGHIMWLEKQHIHIPPPPIPQCLLHTIPKPLRPTYHDQSLIVVGPGYVCP